MLRSLVWLSVLLPHLCFSETLLQIPRIVLDSRMQANASAIVETQWDLVSRANDPLSSLQIRFSNKKYDLSSAEGWIEGLHLEQATSPAPAEMRPGVPLKQLPNEPAVYLDLHSQPLKDAFRTLRIRAHVPNAVYRESDYWACIHVATPRIQNVDIKDRSKLIFRIHFPQGHNPRDAFSRETPHTRRSTAKDHGILIWEADWFANESYSVTACFPHGIIASELPRRKVSFRIPRLDLTSHVHKDASAKLTYDFDIMNDEDGTPVDVIRFGVPEGTDYVDELRYFLNGRELPKEEHDFTFTLYENIFNLGLKNRAIDSGEKARLQLEMRARNVVSQDPKKSNRAITKLRPAVFPGTYFPFKTDTSLRIHLPLNFSPDQLEIDPTENSYFPGSPSWKAKWRIDSVPTVTVSFPRNSMSRIAVQSRAKWATFFVAFAAFMLPQAVWILMKIRSRNLRASIYVGVALFALFSWVAVTFLKPAYIYNRRFNLLLATIGLFISVAMIGLILRSRRRRLAETDRRP